MLELTIMRLKAKLFIDPELGANWTEPVFKNLKFHSKSLCLSSSFIKVKVFASENNLLKQKYFGFNKIRT